LSFYRYSWGLPSCSLVSLRSTRRCKQSAAGSPTRGTVVDNVYRPFAEGGAAYVPVVEFQTHDGETVRFTDGVGTIPPDYEVGTEVKVLYDPDDVHHARVASWKRLWLAPTILTCVGLVPVLIAVVVIWVAGRKLGSSRRPAL